MLVLGLDCAEPSLVFGQFRADLPNLSRLAAEGISGRLESSVPCITVPAWASMLSSRDPGVLGLYGFRNRADHSYAAMTVANSASVSVPRVWDLLSAAGRESVVIGVPLTYPALPLKGRMITDFLTPGRESAFTYPAIFKSEVLQVAPDYTFDVKDYRTADKAGLLQRLIDYAEVQFNVLSHTLTHKPWDFFMHVHMGIDRVHHGFWRYHDRDHRLHEPGSPFQTAIRDYYRLVDTHLGQFLERIDDDVTVLIVSDHGATRIDGGICLNEWLWRAGWLALKTPPAEGQITRFEDAEIDWGRTKAWGSGGYYGRVFMNVAGREPQGIIAPENYEHTREELAAALEAIPGVNGEALNTHAIRPQQVYTQVNGVAPDLIVYFGDLHWRSVGGLGYGSIHTLENDTGPDDANHDVHGIFILRDPRQREHGGRQGHQLMDVLPTILERMGVPLPGDLQGRAIR
jgi:predicted AlkP superfamily phosphohydrolase/phosphomutase